MSISGPEQPDTSDPRVRGVLTGQVKIPDLPKPPNMPEGPADEEEEI